MSDKFQLVDAPQQTKGSFDQFYICGTNTKIQPS
jgi:hypothetical protein